MKKLLLCLIVASVGIPVNAVVPSFIQDKNSFEQLQSLNLWSTGDPLRLHLGCGGSHFDGYINIDFIPGEQSVNGSRGADIYGDVTQLRFANESVDEIRSHHMFEHFSRQTALALLSKWHEWLKVGGVLHLETPDI